MVFLADAASAAFPAYIVLCDTWGHQSVEDDGHIPHGVMPRLPWNKCHAVRPLSIISLVAPWLLAFLLYNGAVNEVSEPRMTLWPTWIFLARQGMLTKLVRWACQSVQPSQRPMATCALIGTVWSQMPLWGAAASRSLALWHGSLYLLMSCMYSAAITALSHILCLWVSESSGNCVPLLMRVIRHES